MRERMSRGGSVDDNGVGGFRCRRHLGLPVDIRNHPRNRHHHKDKPHPSETLKHWDYSQAGFEFENIAGRLAEAEILCDILTKPPSCEAFPTTTHVIRVSHVTAAPLPVRDGCCGTSSAPRCRREDSQSTTGSFPGGAPSSSARPWRGASRSGSMPN